MCVCVCVCVCVLYTLLPSDQAVWQTCGHTHGMRATAPWCGTACVYSNQSGERMLAHIPRVRRHMFSRLCASFHGVACCEAVERLDEQLVLILTLATT